MSNFESWYEEKQSAYLYRHIVEVEPRERYRELFHKLAQAADEQAELWAAKLRESGDDIPLYEPTVRARLVSRLVRCFGPRTVRPVLSAMKVRGLSVYSGSLAAAALGHRMPESVAEIGDRHKGVESGGNLRAAVFGVNDGLISNASLVLGVAGATHDVGVIYLSGVAGLLAGAFSMAAGEYISMRSQRELYEYQIGLERDELEQYPEEEAEELALIYNARGVPMDQARSMAGQLMTNPEHALATLAREELGLNPDDLGSPWGAALSSFAAFAVGAFIPLAPFVAGFGSLMATAVTTLVSLFVVGALLSLFTGRDAFLSGLRMVAIGALAGLVTYAVGSLLGVTVLS